MGHRSCLGFSACRHVCFLSIITCTCTCSTTHYFCLLPGGLVLFTSVKRCCWTASRNEQKWTKYSKAPQTKIDNSNIKRSIEKGWKRQDTAIAQHRLTYIQRKINSKYSLFPFRLRTVMDPEDEPDEPGTNIVFEHHGQGTAYNKCIWFGKRCTTFYLQK